MVPLVVLFSWDFKISGITVKTTQAAGCHPVRYLCSKQAEQVTQRKSDPFSAGLVASPCLQCP